MIVDNCDQRKALISATDCEAWLSKWKGRSAELTSTVGLSANLNMPSAVHSGILNLDTDIIQSQNESQ